MRTRAGTGSIGVSPLTSPQGVFDVDLSTPKRGIRRLVFYFLI
ncbi:MAG: hypothetical protein ACXWWG_00835 [Nitrospira sp.]